MVNGLRTTCKVCGEPIESTNGEGLLSKKINHKKTCHPGFTEVEHVDDVPDPRVIR